MAGGWINSTQFVCQTYTISFPTRSLATSFTSGNEKNQLVIVSVSLYLIGFHEKNDG